MTNIKYTHGAIFTKQTSLRDYAETNKVHEMYRGNITGMQDYYWREREVHLIALFRRENGKLFCRIKCPVNPMPVKGEFEAPSEAAVHHFLVANGWKLKENIYAGIFR